MKAFLGVHDKTGIVDFGRALLALGWNLVATTGTQLCLARAGVLAAHFSELTGTGDLLGGRVKTLHPAIHGGLLYRRGVAQDEAEVERYGLVPIDLVAGNFYPFEKVV